MSTNERHNGGGSARGLRWFLVTFLAISPVPLGSTPPLTWTIWAIILGIATVTYCLTSYRKSNRTAPYPRVMKVGMAMFLALCTYMAMQASPLALLFGPFLVTVSDGSQVAFKTISIAPGDTWLMLIRWVSFGMLFFLAYQAARDKTSATKLLIAISIVVTAHALYGLIALYQLGDTLVGAEKWKYFGVATGTFLNRNSYATYLALGVAITLSLAARSLIRRGRRDIEVSVEISSVVYFVAIGIMITTVVVSNSRAGFAVTCLAIFVIIVATIARNARALRPIVVATPVALSLFAIMFMSFGEQIWRRFEDSAVAFDFRLELYRQVMVLIAQRPLLGFGGGTFEQAFPIVHTIALPNQLTWDEAHNTYLELWADLGLVAGSIPLLLVAGLTIILTSSLARNQGSWVGQAAALAAIAAAGAHALLDFSLEIEAVAFLFVTICAVGLASSQIRKAGD